jgi:trans-2,3-dihydro-3-hydroxyanthranilate isomerase
MRLEFETCDVFTATRFGGNPLAVVFEADALDGAAMQRVAREFNLSETVFVLRAEASGAAARIRIFTPGMELAFAGHPNVGTAVLLARRLGVAASTIALDQRAGRVAATLAREAGEITCAEIVAPAPYATARALDAAAIAACASLPVSALAGAPVLGGCGNLKALAQLHDVAALEAATPDLAAFRAQLPASLTSGLALYAATGPGAWRMRMFGPLAGIAEDPATGSAAVAVAGRLLAASEEPALAGVIAQGGEIGRPSLLAIRAWREAGAIRAAVGGGVVAVARGTIEV